MEERRSPHPMMVEMAEKVLEISGDMQVLKDRQETTYERLFGNGQPGELHHIHVRIGKLEQWRWYLAGVMAAIVGLATLAVEVVRK